jgi:serine/threonine protein kinase
MCASHPFFCEDQATILRNIMYSKVEFPNYISPTARSFIESLLDRNPQTRLGSAGAGGQDIQNHPFFQNLDFGRLFKLQITPPFIPEIADDLDVRFFDEVFTDEPIDQLTPTSSIFPPPILE